PDAEAGDVACLGQVERHEKEWIVADQNRKEADEEVGHEVGLAQPNGEWRADAHEAEATETACPPPPRLGIEAAKIDAGRIKFGVAMFPTLRLERRQIAGDHGERRFGRLRLLQLANLLLLLRNRLMDARPR